MKLWKVILAFILLGVAAVLALMISGFVLQGLILPGARFVWIFRGYFGSIPQSVLWAAAIACMLGLAAWSVGTARISLPEEWNLSQKELGDVHQLSFWLRRIKRGPYPRWFVAHTLADLALEILRGRGSSVERGGQLAGPGWNPPENIQKYLEAAMRSTPATFGQKIRQVGITSDPEPKAILDYLENYMENSDES